MEPLYSTKRGPLPSGAMDTITEITDLDQFDIDTLLVPLPSFEKSALALRYRDDVLEREFLSVRSLYGKYRFLLVCFWLLLAGGIYALQVWRLNGDHKLGITLFTGSLLGFCCEAVLLCYASRIGAPTHLINGLRELLCLAYLTYFCCDMGVFAARAMQRDICQWLHTYDSRAIHIDCQWRVMGLYFIGGFLPVVIGRPRYFLSVVPILAGTASSFVINSSIVELRTIVAWCVIAPLYALLCVVMKRADELKHRDHFEVTKQLAARTQQRRVAEDALTTFALSVTPRHLHRRLLECSTIVVDVSTSATVVIIDTFDSNAIINAMMPAQAALTFAAISTRCAHRAADYGFSLIRSIGDSSWAVSGLFDTRGGDQQLAREKKLSGSPSFGVAFALDVLTTNYPTLGLTLRAAIDRGKLLGMPMGTTGVRYDIFGPAVRDCTNLLLSVPAHRVRVSAPLVAEVEKHFQLTHLCTLDKVACADVLTTRAAMVVVDGILDELSRSSSPSNGQQQQQQQQQQTVVGVGEGNKIVEASEPRAEERSELDAADADADHGITLAESSAARSLVPPLSGKGFLRRGLSMFSRAGSVHSSPPAITSFHLAAASVMVHEEDLTMEQRWGADFFANPATAAAQRQHHRDYDRRHFGYSCIFHFVMLTAVTALALEDRHRDFDIGLYTATAMLLVCLTGFGALGLLVFARTPVDGSRLFFANAALCCAAVFATNLTRPSITGDDTGFLLLMMGSTLGVSGGSLFEVVLAQVILLLVDISMTVLYRPLLVPGNVVYQPLFYIVIVSVSYHRDSQLKQLFRDTVNCQQTDAEVHQHAAVRRAIMRGLIPRQLQARINPTMVSSHALSAWAIDEVAVVCIDFLGLRVPASVPGASSHCSDDSGGGSSEDRWARMQSRPDEWQVSVESRLGVLESAVLGCPHGTLDVVHVFGGTVIVAGPLIEGATAQRPTLCDMMHLINVLLRLNMALTVGAAQEQAINVVRQSEFPTHDIFGLGVQMARALMRESGGPMIAVTERIARLHQQEQRVADRDPGAQWRLPPDLHFADAGTWRLRSLGSRRVFRATHASSTSLHASSTSPFVEMPSTARHSLAGMALTASESSEGRRQSDGCISIPSVENPLAGRTRTPSAPRRPIVSRDDSDNGNHPDSDGRMLFSLSDVRNTEISPLTFAAV